MRAFCDRRLAKSQLNTALLPQAWVKLSSQQIIMTDGQSKNAIIPALSAKGVDTRLFKRLTCAGMIVEEAEEDLLGTMLTT